MEYDSKINGASQSPGTKEGESGITHFLIQAKQTIQFNEEESEKFKDEIFSILKDFNCRIFTNLLGVEIIEEEVIEISNYNDPRIEKIRNKLRKKVTESTRIAIDRLEKRLSE